MAIVVIIIMVGFIGGSSLLQQFSRRQVRTVAHYGQKGKIDEEDLYYARQELELLSVLRADDLLRNQDLRGILLGELLFAEQRISPELVNYIKQAVRQNQYRISDEQINQMYTTRMGIPPSVYWILLSDETEKAGIRIPNDQVGQLLGKVIPQLFDGASYSQVINSIMSQRGIPEEQILATLGKLLSILQYAHTICSSEDVTTRQVENMAAYERETINVEFVRFDAVAFEEFQDRPSEEQILGQFNKYKNIIAGDVTEENPYGFGYKIADRVQLEYITLKLADVRGIVKAPTLDQMEEYYDSHKQQMFTEQVRSNPDDPNSALVTRTKSYAEVARDISEQIVQEKINTTAERILQEARTLTEANLDQIADQSEEITTEQLKELSGDYKTIAEQLEEKYKVQLYYGRTGLLSPVDMKNDDYLSRLYLASYGRNPVGLAQIVFAVKELELVELGIFDVAQPRMYGNIGPLKDIMQNYMGSSGAIMSLVRVIEAQKAHEPESIDLTFETGSMILDPNQPTEDNIYSVKENVTKDLMQLDALETVKEKAEEFADLIESEDWNAALKQVNDAYKQARSDGEPNQDDPNEFMLQDLTDLRRISKADLETLIAQNQSDPASLYFMYEHRIQSRFVDKLYSLVPPDANSLEDTPLIVEFKPDMSYYVVKNLEITRLWKEQFEQIKPMLLFRNEHVQAQSLAIVHFNPENILKRTKFEAVRVDEAEQESEPVVTTEEEF